MDCPRREVAVIDYDTTASFATVFDGVDVVIGVAALNLQSGI